MDHHEDAHDQHHGHHDDADHEDDPLHGHHGHFSHDHHHGLSKTAGHHHHDGDHLLLHNHPDDHMHHGHAGKDKHHHGEETLSLILLQPEIDYLNLPGTTSLEIKVKATVFDDQDHHHHVAKHAGPEGESKGQSHDHVHHANRLNPPAFNIETDQLLFRILGPATTDQRLLAGEPVVTLGNWVSGAGSDLQFDDTSYYTIRSESLSQAPPGDKSSFNHVVEFEVTSDAFAFPRVDTISVPITLRTGETKKAKIRMFVSNPAHGGDGFSSEPGLSATIKAPNIDRAYGLDITRKDINYLNDLSPVAIKVRIRVSLDREFELAVDAMSFIATTTDTQSAPVRPGAQNYIDPGLKDPDMAVIPFKTGYLLRVNNIQPGVMNINWGFEPHVHGAGEEHNHDHLHDEKRDIAIEVYRGLLVNSPPPGQQSPPGQEGRVVVEPGRIDREIPIEENTLVAGAHVHPHHGSSSVSTGFFEVDTGIYSVLFFNADSQHGGGNPKFSIVSKPFTVPGPGDSSASFVNSTGLYAPIYKDYVILARSGDVFLKAVVRQIPGPTAASDTPWAADHIAWPVNQVFIQSWDEPIDLGIAPVGGDGDGIQNEVDGRFIDGEFEDESGTPSARFTDEHRGGTTSGTVSEGAGLDINVKDLNDPTLGVLIWATGAGEGTATVALCGIVLRLTIGDIVKVTCGSLTVEVVDGPVEVALGAGFVVKVP